MALRVDADVEEVVGGQMRGAHLQEVDVHIHHGVAEVGLDIGHGLPLDLQPVAHPDSTQNLIEEALEWNFIKIVFSDKTKCCSILRFQKNL